MNVFKRFSFTILFLGIIFYGCRKDEAEIIDAKGLEVDTVVPETSNVRVFLTDAPGDYKAVYIDIQDVQVKSTDTTKGWVSLDSIQTGIYDLLKLSNGLDTLLGNAMLPAGKLSQIRLILGSNNSVVLKNNDSIQLKTPSAQQSGLKLQLNDSLIAGVTYDIILDFDACKSVVKAGKSGKYNLKPVIRTITKANSGAIAGIVMPDSLTIAAIGILGPDSSGTYTDASGAFLIRGLAPGTYSVFVDPGSGSGLSDTLISNVTVSIGTVTNVGKINL